MTTHLSVRLAWHDRGWDGHVCNAPHLNSSCMVLPHIRDSRQDDKERSVAGTAFAKLDGWLPPCSRDPGVYANQGYKVIHRDPLDFRGLPQVGEEIPPYSSCPSPYRWMREENFRTICEAENLSIRTADPPREYGWVYDPDRQRELLKHFWEKIESKKSLVFYYCNQGNPLDENASRIIVGVGRVAQVSAQLYFGTKKNYQDLYPVWSRAVTQDYPDQGVRIPYHEYMQSGHQVEEIICRVPQNALLDFSYVGEHVSDDIAVAILERIIQSIEKVRQRLSGDWDRQLAWLNDALAEVWSGRGPFPGLGSVLQYLSFEKGTAYHSLVLAPMAKTGVNPWDYVLSILEGNSEPEEGPYKNGLLKARHRWLLIASRHDLLASLARFELSPDQVERLANPDLRAKSGIMASESELTANPFIISEFDLGTFNSAPVALETIDHGMRPEGDATLFPSGDRVNHDDRRRVRALACILLKEAAGNGDTVLTLHDLFQRIETRFPDRRACRPDREIFLAEAGFYKEILWIEVDEKPQRVALKNLYDLEQKTTAVIKRRAGKKVSTTVSAIAWMDSLEHHFGAPKTSREKAALYEKAKVLETLYTRSLGVLTGGAGTGKTSVIKVLLDELENLEGKQPILLLAPTGKARVRLAKHTQRNAMTIHQFLLKQGWFYPDSFALRSNSDRDKYKAATVIIDECSMIPSDLLGTLLAALDFGPLKRLILVGDPYQLPPIGPGRPFVDIIEWLKGDNQLVAMKGAAIECIAPLTVCMRKNEDNNGSTDSGSNQHDETHGGGGSDGSGNGFNEHLSVALSFAEGYRSDGVHPADDEILATLAKGGSHGDLEVVFWKDHDDLILKLKEKMKSLLNIPERDYQAFNRSLGIDQKDWEQSENWQVLSPTRVQSFGTDELNRLIQRVYKGGLIKASQGFKSKMPKPFGDQEIVWTDKVIQTINRGMKGWPQKTGFDYVANGEIGIVSFVPYPGKGKDYLDVVFSTQSKVSYRYFRNQVNDNLELAYALTVHKAQGSDFQVVFFIIPQEASTLSRELIYTGLTRFRRRLVLLIEKDISPLMMLRSSQYSDTRLRNTQMFNVALRPESVTQLYPETLIHRTKKGVPVRSKSEVIVADIIDGLGISYEYEKPLYAGDNPKDFRLPDFTVSFEGDVYYWEHLGMLLVPSYREGWERKLAWYKDNGYEDSLIVSQDGPNGSIDAKKIEQLVRERILQEGSD